MHAEIVDAQRDTARWFVLGLCMNDLPRGGPVPVRRRGAWFIAVGCVAALVHLGVVIVAVGSFGLPPLVANIGGWLIAFCASFAGHHRLTFRGHDAPVALAAGRFLLLSAAGFAANEISYAALLHWTSVRYDMGLAVVLMAVAAATYWLSRHWVFLRSPRR